MISSVPYYTLLAWLVLFVHALFFLLSQVHWGGWRSSFSLSMSRCYKAESFGETELKKKNSRTSPVARALIRFAFRLTGRSVRRNIHADWETSRAQLSWIKPLQVISAFSANSSVKTPLHSRNFSFFYFRLILLAVRIVENRFIFFSSCFCFQNPSVLYNAFMRRVTRVPKLERSLIGSECCARWWTPDRRCYRP